MRAFKGCVNLDCDAYKKIHYKKNDQFCVKCGSPLSFVCAGCWKPMESDEERYCIGCTTEKEQKKAQAVDKAKTISGVVVGTMGAAAGVVEKVGNNTDKIANGAKKVVDAGVKLKNIKDLKI